MDGLVLPPGVEPFDPNELRRGERVMVVNETGLPDAAIHDEVVEMASLNSWGQGTTFQYYANQQGSMLARADYRVPDNVFEEISLSRDLADRDDDVRAAMGALLAAAFEGGMRNFHQDAKTVALFDSICENAGMLHKAAEFYREYLIAGAIHATTLFTRTNLDYQPFAADTLQSESVAAPLCGVLPAENVRVIGNDMFGTAVLAYDPESPGLRAWLDTFFDPRTSAATKHKMALADRVSANLFTGLVPPQDPLYQTWDQIPRHGMHLYVLNPRMVDRITMPKGAAKYARPPLCANFPLLEAKRLLNIMDYALLQGGCSFIVVAKKGSDDHPALPEEIDNLKQVVRKASRTGVIVGDHRLNFDIITPDLSEMLNHEKRRLIGKKLAMALLRSPERGTDDGGGPGVEAEMELLARVVMHDRGAVKCLIEDNIYSEVRRRNGDLFSKGAACVWFPKVVLAGTNFFNDLVLKLRDRGDIPRGWAVEAAGFPWDAAIAARQQELDAKVDETMMPGAVPFNSLDAGPQDNSTTGRPPGSKTGGGGQDPAAPKKTVTRNRGETIKADYDPALERVVRAGEITAAILEEYPEYDIGRIKSIEREVMESGEAAVKAGAAMIPVNPGHETDNEKALNLTEGLRMIVGETLGRRAFVAKLLIFREPEFSTDDAESRAARWGYPLTILEPDDAGAED